MVGEGSGIEMTYDLWPRRAVRTVDGQKVAANGGCVSEGGGQAVANIVMDVGEEDCPRRGVHREVKCSRLEMVINFFSYSFLCALLPLVYSTVVGML